MFSYRRYLDRDRRTLKSALWYLAISVLCVLINRIYALFGHGVQSAYMSFMFLYPLIGGTAAFLLLWFFQIDPAKEPHFRALYNLYNSGIATLTVGSMLNGVFEIAGTNSSYITVFWLAGWLLIGIGGIGFIADLIMTRMRRKLE